MYSTSRGIFDPNQITKYWKNQKASVKGKFVDPFFPPDSNSLEAKDKNGNWIDPESGPIKFEDIKDVQIEWKRASEIFSKFLVFDDKIEFDDVKQGILGNCYFLSAIAAMTEFPNLIYQVFRTKDVNPEGYYEVVMFIDGEWQVVILDDYFPLKKGTKEFAFSRPNGNELWAILLEKAWAKVNGGYVNIISGWPDQPLAALTGFAASKLDHQTTDKEELWNVILQSDKSDNIMCTSSKNEASITELGLVINHAYTLIGAKEIHSKGQIIRLVKIRNPWGYKEWNGKWSDKSDAWTPEIKQQVGYSNADDGTFYISFEDFIGLFSSTNICYVMHDSNIKSFTVREDINKPNVLNLYLNEDGRVSISVLFKHWRYNRELKNDNHPVSLMIAKYDEFNKTFTEVDGEYFSYENVEYVKDLQKGFYVVWIYCSYDYCKDPKPEKYVIRIVSPVYFKAKIEATDPECEFLGELITSGVKERFASQIDPNKQFFKIENSFKRSGIGYRCIINNSPTVYQKWVHDPSRFENVTLLPPFQTKGKESFDLWVPPSGYGICMGMRTAQWGTYWFNLKSTYFSYSCNPGENPLKKNPINIENYVSMDVLQDNPDENYYDYISTSLAEAKKVLQFHRINAVKTALEDLMKEHGDLLKHIIDLEPTTDDSELSWVKLKYENGFYVGQLNTAKERHGRGVYFWNSDKSYYMGYWNHGIKDKFGKCFNSNLKLVYEGGYTKRARKGLGTFYFNNEDKYQGKFDFDKRQGKGTYFWKDGSMWVRTFTAGQLDGSGMFYPVSGSPWPVEYKNGQYVK